ncbi:MAG: glycosyltransferase family 10 [Ferruginibacter sp.]
MIKIKVSTPWDHINFSERISSKLTGYQFIFDTTVIECDYWIIWGGIKGVEETTNCDPSNIIYLSDEAHEERFFNKYFLNQFASIITCRTDIKHRSVIPTHELNTWLIKKSYDQIYNENFIPKTKILSVISSDQTWLPGHKLRFAFVNKLIGHFKDKLDVFGKGFNPIADKYDGLAPYKYSVAIENSIIPGYFTEKIADCYLAHTMPIYYGCPDIGKYFDNKSFLYIDPQDYTIAFKKIEKLIEEDPYDQLLSVIEGQKKKYLEEYHIFNKLIRILESNFNPSGQKKKITIKNERCYQRGYKVNNFVHAAFKNLRLPPQLYFQVKFAQNSTYANNLK